MIYIDYIIIALQSFATLFGFIFGLRGKVIKQFILLLAIMTALVLSQRTTNYFDDQGLIFMIQKPIGNDIPYRDYVTPIVVKRFISITITIIDNYLVKSAIIKQTHSINNRVLGTLGILKNIAIYLTLTTLGLIYVGIEIVYFLLIVESIKVLQLSVQLIQTSTYFIENKWGII